MSGSHTIGTGATIALVCLCALGCGATASGISTELANPDADFDARGMLRLYATTGTELLRPREQTLVVLDARVESLSGEEQRQAQIDLAVLHIHAMSEAALEGALAHREEAQSLLREAARGSRDPELSAQIDFLQLWTLWESGEESTASQVRRYIRHHGDRNGVMIALAWLIKGELAMQRQRYDHASRAFRFVLDQVGHPLYGYALYRTARCWAALGEVTLSRDALGEVERLGCPVDASPLNLTLSARAGQQLGHLPLVEMSDDERRTVCEDALIVSGSGG